MQDAAPTVAKLSVNPFKKRDPNLCAQLRHLVEKVKSGLFYFIFEILAAPFRPPFLKTSVFFGEHPLFFLVENNFFFFGIFG